ncbi:MAG: glycosyltransferase family 2 protein [Chloroflexota bacterium]|nr:glycosyltransferase family 2 protein [Dehalococcoidia bacterium]MDW8252393.1 glycosyltransferase family 2 protein [Chloroflexota bacterium]
MTVAASVIIPNWNGRAYLPTCLGALARQTRQDFETILVDDASTDDSVRYVAEAFPWVRIIRLRRNGHFARAVNLGICAARSEVIVLLNNDTEPEPGWLEALLAALEAHPEAGMATSKLLLFDRRNVLHSAGDLLRLDGRPGNRGVWEEDRGQYDESRWVFGACGGAAAFRRAMLEEVGLFDEAFTAYCEDVDLSFRAQLAGYRCRFVPEARVYHRLSATGGGPRASYLCAKNIINVLVKNMPAELARRHWPKIVWAQARLASEALRHARQPAARAWLRGQLAALGQLPTMLAKRRRIQARRRVPIAAIEALLEAG